MSMLDGRIAKVHVSELVRIDATRLIKMIQAMLGISKERGGKRELATTDPSHGRWIQKRRGTVGAEGDARSAHQGRPPGERRGVMIPRRLDVSGEQERRDKYGQSWQKTDPDRTVHGLAPCIWVSGRVAATLRKKRRERARHAC